MANILIAAAAGPRAVLERILAGHELTCAGTMAQAKESLGQQHFDLIICTILFDESRMFEFVRLVKSRLEWKQIPLVCARALTKTLRSPLAIEAVEFTCRALGADAFLDIASYRSEPEREMRDAINNILANRGT